MADPLPSSSAMRGENEKEPCPLCVAGGFPEFCSSEHTDDVRELAWALSRYVQGRDATAEQASWFLEDAAAMEGEVSPPFEVTNGGGKEVVLHNSDGFFAVNGVIFWLDPNGEAGTVPWKAAVCECHQPFPDEDELARHRDEAHV